MKILVLGANGQLGLCLADQLANTQYQVWPAGRDEINILDYRACRKAITTYAPDIIINASAYTAVDKAESEQDLANQVNHLAVDHIAQLCAEIGVFFIHISTDYVFDGTARTPYNEDAAANPQGMYGKTKLDGERAIAASGCAYVILRTAWVFSEYGNNFLKTMLSIGQKMDSVNIVQDQIGCPTYAQDIASATLAIIPYITDGTVQTGLYHYCGDKACSWFDFAKEIFNQAAIEGLKTPKTINAIMTSAYPTAAIRPAYTVLESSKFTGTFNLPASDWQAAIPIVIGRILAKSQT